MDVSAVMSDDAESTDSGRDHGIRTSSNSTQTLLTGLQALTQRLQDERDTLQQALDDATRALQTEQAARAALENALQVRELELLHVTQTQQHATQQLRERITLLERERDDARALHQAAIAGRTTAQQQRQALADEVKHVELKWRKEMEKKELALAEVEILREDARTIAYDRDQLVARTEADAKRVRALWQQIVHEHATKCDAQRLELEAAQRDLAAAVHSKATLEQQTQALETAVATLTADNAALQQQCNANVAAMQAAQRKRDAQLHALELTLQQRESNWALAMEREKAATRDQQLAKAVLVNCRRKFDATTEELIVLKREFSELLDQHEQNAVQTTQAAREQVAHVQMKAKALKRSKQRAEELAALRHAQLQRYRRVLAAVSHRLDDVRDTHASLEANAWSLHNDARQAPATTSLCIHRH